MSEQKPSASTSSPLRGSDVSDDPFVSFPVSDATKYTVASVPREDMMTVEQVRAKWDEIFAHYRARDATTKTLMMNAIRMYSVMNGTSPRNNYTTAITIQGQEYPVIGLSAILGSKVRQFFRPQAQQVSELLLHNPQLAKEAAAKWGLGEDLGPYAFDYSEYIPHLPVDYRNRIMAAKNKHIDGSERYQRDFAGEVVGTAPQQTSPPSFRGAQGDEY